MWGRELWLIKQQLNFWQYIFKWEHRNQISDNQHIWKKFAPRRELQKQWGTESHTKAEAAGGWPGERGKLEMSGGKGRQPGLAGNSSPGLLAHRQLFLLPHFLRKM